MENNNYNVKRVILSNVVINVIALNKRYVVSRGSAKAAVFIWPGDHVIAAYPLAQQGIVDPHQLSD